MITLNFSSNFDEDSLQEKVLEVAKNSLREKLKAHGISGLTISADKREGGEWGLKLTGPQDQLDKANEMLRQK